MGLDYQNSKESCLWRSFELLLISTHVGRFELCTKSNLADIINTTRFVNSKKSKLHVTFYAECVQTVSIESINEGSERVLEFRA